jgi:sugar phosphate isomerase/epimerase
MNGNIRIGFSMHPRWVDGVGLKTFIEPLRQVGLSALEFELDDHLDGWTASLILMKEAVSMGLDLSFHAPYRAPHSLVGFAGGNRPVLEREFRPLLEVGENWAVRMGKKCVLVMHAAASRIPADPASLVVDTIAYLKWVAEAFPHLHLALENNHSPEEDQVKVGVQRTDILRMVDCLPPDRLGICWDMGHDFLSQQPQQPPPEWFSRVIHVHIHEVDSAGRDHFPLVMGNDFYTPWLHGLVRVGMNGIVVLELKGGHLTGWSMEQIKAALVSSVEKISREIA